MNLPFSNVMGKDYQVDAQWVISLMHYQSVMSSNQAVVVSLTPWDPQTRRLIVTNIKVRKLAGRGMAKAVF